MARFSLFVSFFILPAFLMAQAPELLRTSLLRQLHHQDGMVGFEAQAEIAGLSAAVASLVENLKHRCVSRQNGAAAALQELASAGYGRRTVAAAPSAIPSSFCIIVAIV